MEMGIRPLLLEEMGSAFHYTIFPFTKCAGEPDKVGHLIELRLLQAVKWHIELQQFLGIEPPVFIMVSLLGVRGYKISRGGHPPNCTEEIDRTNLIIPEVVLDTFDGGYDHIAEVMRPVFDTTWNAANYASSPNYDEDGKYLRLWN